MQNHSHTQTHTNQGIAIDLGTVDTAVEACDPDRRMEFPHVEMELPDVSRKRPKASLESPGIVERPFVD
jgi:hypothetical protein